MVYPSRRHGRPLADSEVLPEAGLGWHSIALYADCRLCQAGEGNCLAHVPYGQEQLLVHDLGLSRATRLCAHRFNPVFYPPA